MYKIPIYLLIPFHHLSLSLFFFLSLFNYFSSVCFLVEKFLLLVKEGKDSSVIPLRNLMDGCQRNGEISPKLLDLIPQGRRNWFQGDKNSVFNTEEKKLELKLGPPGEEEDGSSSMIIRHIKKEPKDKSILSLAGKHFSPSSTNKTTSHKRFKTS